MTGKILCFLQPLLGALCLFTMGKAASFHFGPNRAGVGGRSGSQLHWNAWELEGLRSVPG